MTEAVALVGATPEVPPTVAAPEPARFPFGSRSTPRPVRPATRTTDVFVVGLYPAAVNVRWEPPSWLREMGVAIDPVRSLAIADEPVMFWDGERPAFDLTAWLAAVRFRPGNGWPAWGHVPKLAPNGSAARAVERDVLDPLGIRPDHATFAGVVDRFHLKHRRARDDGRIVDAVYTPFVEALLRADEEAPPFATIPGRAKPSVLVARVLALGADRLATEIVSAESRLLVTLGEEARQVVHAIADRVTGPPAEPLTAADGGYGAPGTARIGPCTAAWLALATPGQPPGPWRRAHDAWRNGDR